jgi:hypothetical protein
MRLNAKVVLNGGHQCHIGHEHMLELTDVIVQLSGIEVLWDKLTCCHQGVVGGAIASPRVFCLPSPCAPGIHFTFVSSFPAAHFTDDQTSVAAYIVRLAPSECAQR